jgi:hypothetical protein
MAKPTTLPFGTRVEGCTAQGNGPYDPNKVLKSGEYCSINTRQLCPGPEHCFKVQQAEAARPLERFIHNERA